MHLLNFILPAIATAATIPAQQKPLLQTQDSSAISPTYRIPTVHESAIMARRMLRKESIATLSTIFPASSSHDDLTTLEDRPSDVDGKPFALIEYIADCEPGTGNPTVLAVDIATTFKNWRAGSNVTMSLRWHPPAWEEGKYSAARMPRYSLVGTLEEIDDSTVEEHDIKQCFLDKHWDVIWSPGNDIHTSRWTRFVVKEVYWFGGFGDRSRIGWIPIDEWAGVTTEEVDSCRLPGEESKLERLLTHLPGFSASSSKNSCPWTY